jgi:predicted alpha-1,6-mannanase (GH76 family)
LAAYQAYAASCLEALQGWYNWNSGQWTTTGWWNAANAVYAIADYSSLVHSDHYIPVIANTFDKNKQRGFLNRYYDDEGWWALAWLKAYDLTNELRYLEMAAALFADMITGWDNICDGGLWWRKDRDYKNAIPNVLFFSVATRLFRRTETVFYLNWAAREWLWFLDSGMQNAHYLINDGLKDCLNNGGVTWTYNQGVILGALAEMYLCTVAHGPYSQGEGEIQYLNEANNIAHAVLSMLLDGNGVLVEPIPIGSKDQNAPQFKGIFMQNLASFYHVASNVKNLPFDVDPYRQFLEKNANSIWQLARSPRNTFGFNWSSPVDREDATRQISALMAFNAAIPFSSP